MQQMSLLLYSATWNFTSFVRVDDLLFLHVLKKKFGIIITKSTRIQRYK